MTAPVWPSTTGFVLADGWRETFPDLVARSAVDAGPARQRRLAANGLYQVEAVVLLTPDERDWLRDFHRGEAAAGAVWFDWTHPALAATVAARFVAGQAPALTAMKPDWLARISLEVVLPLGEGETPDADPAWPDDFGVPLGPGYRETLPDGAIRTGAGGPVRQRRTTTAGPVELDVGYLFTAASQIQTLRVFHRCHAAGGAVWFDWVYPPTGDTVRARFVAGRPPTVETAKPGWLARLTLEADIPFAEA